MPSITANTTTFAIATFEPEFTDLVNTAANTRTKVMTAGAKGSVVTDILFRSTDASARVFNIIICPTGQEATAKYSIVAVTINALSGNNGSAAVASLASIAPQLFNYDLAGNRARGFETGWEIWIQNTSTLVGTINVMADRRNY